MSSFRIRYQTLEIGEFDIHLRSLRDALEYSDDDGEAAAHGIVSSNWGLFGVVWASGRALARLMLERDIVGKRILELGCGLGLASLVLNERVADITATDYHPSAAAFLAANVELNSGRAIPFVRAAWLDNDPAPSSLGEFDLIIASDVLYESAQLESLSVFIDRHASASCEIVIVDPNRGNSGRFRAEMRGLGWSSSRAPAASWDGDEDPFDGQVLSFVRETG